MTFKENVMSIVVVLLVMVFAGLTFMPFITRSAKDDGILILPE